MPELSSKQWSQFLALLGKLKFFIVDPRGISWKPKTGKNLTEFSGEVVDLYH